MDGKKVVITYGTYDLFHYGHRALLENAKALGDYLIVGVTSDAFDRSRGKLNVRQSLAERIHAVEETGLADKIIVEEYRGQKIEDIRRYQVDVFTVGSDWIGKFDYLKEYCDVVYLPRTQGVSSTELRSAKTRNLRLGCFGAEAFTGRIIRESAFVSEVDITAVASVEGHGSEEAYGEGAFEIVSSLSEMVGLVDAVYLSVSPKIRHVLIREALESGLHVLCEGPIAYSLDEAVCLQEFASSRRLVLIEALTVLHEPGFQRLQLLLESGAIGEIKDIDVSYSQVPLSLDYEDRHDGSFYSMSSRTMLPALVLLGCKPLASQLICGYDKDFCTWSKCNLLYNTATATLKTGRGVKTEGDMTITGTDGYIYVPAPWWKLEYFEIRGEDLRNIRKHYYECLGEGQRYLIKDFFGYCADWGKYSLVKTLLEDLEKTTVGFIEQMDRGSCIKLENNSNRFGGGEAVTASV